VDVFLNRVRGGEVNADRAPFVAFLVEAERGFVDVLVKV